MSSESIAGREIVLAGGAGGLGSATAEALASDGARVVVSYLSNAVRASKLAGIASVVQCDLTVAADRQRLLNTAPAIYGLVVFTGDPARVSDSTGFERQMHRSHQVNYAGPILLAREAVARMIDTKTPGAIVLLSTIQAVALFPSSTAYSGAKAALLHSARILAKECRAPANIRVNVIAPGVMAAGMAEASIASGKYNRFLEDGTISRFGSAADIARAVRYLLEPDNYVTGQVLSVDGGITL